MAKTFINPTIKFPAAEWKMLAEVTRFLFSQTLMITHVRTLTHVQSTQVAKQDLDSSHYELAQSHPAPSQSVNKCWQLQVKDFTWQQ